MPHLHAAPAPPSGSNDNKTAEGRHHHHEHHDRTTTTMTATTYSSSSYPSSSTAAVDSLVDEMPIQFASKGYFGTSDPTVLALASKSKTNDNDGANHVAISSFESTSTDSSTNIISTTSSSPPPNPSSKNGLPTTGKTTYNTSSKSMISPSPSKVTIAGARIASDESSFGGNKYNSGTGGHGHGHENEGPALTIYGSPRWTHSPIQVQRRVVSEEDEERPGEYDGWKTTGTRNKYGYQYNYGRHDPTHLRYAQVPPEYGQDGLNAPLRPTGSFHVSSPSPSPSESPTTTGKKMKRSADEDGSVPIEKGVSPQPKKVKSEAVVDSEAPSGHPNHDAEEDKRKDARSSNGTERAATSSSKRASPPGHDHPYPQPQYGHPPPHRHHQQQGAHPDEYYHHQHHHHHPGSYRSADPTYQEDHRSDPHRHRNHYGHHHRHNLHGDPFYRGHTAPPPPQLSRSSSMPDRKNHHYYYPYQWVEDRHGYRPVGGPPPGPGVGAHPPSYPPPHHQHRRHGSPCGAGGYDSTFRSTYPPSHGHGRRHPTSTNRCVKLEEPIPPKSAWSDVGKALEVVLPDFHRLVNYPDYLTKGGRHNHSPDGSIENGTSNTEGRRNCVMCGKLRICSAASLMQNQRGRHVALRGTDVGSSSSSGDDSTDEKDDGTAHIIPKQNKGLCTACDVTIWVMTSNGMEIKWCKGCKNFRPWAGFGEKGLATKCVRCRDRQREKYRSAKK